MSQPTDIETKLREADRRLAMEIAVEMELHATLGTTTKSKADAIEEMLAPAFATLRKQVSDTAGALNEIARNLWYDATNAVCQSMQDADLCKCADGQCIAASVEPTPEDIGAFRAALASLKGEADASHGQITQREDEANSAIAEGKKVVRYLAQAATPPAERVVEEATRYAERLANVLWEKHYRNAAPNWKPLTGDLIGILTQIDNMTSGLALATNPAVKDDETVVEARDDLFTHRDAWRVALVEMRNTSEVSSPDIDDQAYWQHELDVFDRVFAALTTKPAVKDDEEVVEALLNERQKRAEQVHDRILAARDGIRVNLSPDSPEWLRDAFNKLHEAHHIMGGDPFDMHMRAALAAKDGRS